MASNTNGSGSAGSRRSRQAPEEDINILLMGQTGVGKSTFINAFANYLMHDTFDQAMNAEIKVVIPSSFSYTDPDTFEQRIIKTGDENAAQEAHKNGQSCTQQCRSYVFRLGDRIIRVIDTPGMGDTRGSEQDSRNLFEILTYISHYEHLNGICIFLKPDETRLNIAFRLCIREILHHLHQSARENLMFIFTNTRSTFYTPGSSNKLLQVLLDEYRKEHDSQIPFSKQNTFLLDNEPYNGLVLHRNHVSLAEEQLDVYKNSWNHSAKEYQRLFAYINSRPLHALSNTLSLNECEQLIRKLPRPIAEILRLIQQNILFIKESKEDLHKDGQSRPCELAQSDATTKELRYPILLCTHKNCSRMPGNPNEQPRELYKTCQEKSYLNGGLQEVLGSATIAQCDLFDKETDECRTCQHSWKHHMNITYEFRTTMKRMNTKNQDNDSSSPAYTAEKRLSELQDEQSTILDVYKKLSKFLRTNALHPLDDDIIFYLKLFIREEEMRKEAGVRNEGVIEGLKKILAECEAEMNVSQAKTADESEKLKDEEIFSSVGTLYHLKINGGAIRNQVSLIQVAENSAVHRMECRIKLPDAASSSKIMNSIVTVDKT